MTGIEERQFIMKTKIYKFVVQLSPVFFVFLIVSMMIGQVGAVTECNERDVQGWMTAKPTPYDPSASLLSPKQKGSRLIYISSVRGKDETGDFYFWDGVQIVDSQGKSRDSKGMPYGDDPVLPTNAVRPFKSWAAVAPRNDPGELGTLNPSFGTTPVTRAGYPDWWLFARNETFDLASEFRNLVPTVASNPNFVASLAVSGGRSFVEPQVISAFGSYCLPRPRFTNAVHYFITRFESSYAPPFRNVLYSSLHFDGRGLKEGTGGLFLLGQTTQSKGIVFEDIWFDAAHINIGQKNNGEITIRRSLITDVHSVSGNTYAQGVYFEGGSDGTLRIEESILLRNGFRGDPKAFSWPPAGDQVWNIKNRNLYLTGETQSAASGFFDSVSMMGTSGDQFRQGMRIERSFFYQGYLFMGGAGGRLDNQRQSGVITNNVLQRFEAKGTADNRGHPGWGIELGWAANSVKVTGNIVTGAQHPATSYAIKFSPHEGCPFSAPTQYNHVFGNILDTGSADAAVLTVDGVLAAPNCTQPWRFPGVFNNVVNSNSVINSKRSPHLYLPKAAALNTITSTYVVNNDLLIDRNQGMANFNWKDPNRTLRTYLLSKGLPVKSDDGFPEYFTLATTMQRGRWDERWGARSIVNYIRTGFNLPTLD
jgi:hypothetical protein